MGDNVGIVFTNDYAITINDEAVSADMFHIYKILIFFKFTFYLIFLLNNNCQHLRVQIFQHLMIKKSLRI